MLEFGLYLLTSIWHLLKCTFCIMQLVYRLHHNLHEVAMFSGCAIHVLVSMYFISVKLNIFDHLRCIAA